MIYILYKAKLSELDILLIDNYAKHVIRVLLRIIIIIDFIYILYVCMSVIVKNQKV